MAEYNGVHIDEYKVRGVPYVRLWWYTGQGSKRGYEGLGRRDKLNKGKINRERLAKEKELALQPGRVGAGEAPTLKAWCSRYKATRSGLASSSVALLDKTIEYLTDHFGEDRKIDSITRSDAADWRAHLAKQPGKKEGTLMSESTVCRYIRDAGTIFGATHGALKYDLVPFNPFDREKSSVKTAKKGYPQLDADGIARLIDAAPSPGWRAFIAMCAFAGPRKGEAMEMTWADVRWGDGLLRIPNVKTGKQSDGTYTKRDCLLEPELERILLECYEASDDERVVPISKNNQHRIMTQIIERAGFDVWADPFHALRRMRESYWMEQHPEPYVAGWMGHSEQVSREHYASTPRNYFTKVRSEVERLKADIDKLSPEQIARVQAMVDEFNEDSAQQRRNTTNQQVDGEVENR